MIGVSCRFLGSDKAYTYKTNLDNLTLGDLVVVESNKPSERVVNMDCFPPYKMNVLSILEVVDIDVPFSTSIKYKWIIDKINLEDYFHNIIKGK